MRTYQRIYSVVKKIPRGRVATYGQIAGMAGLPGRARQAGYALSALKDEKVPWHRVVNAQGKISSRAMSFHEKTQRKRLEREGVVFNSENRISLQKFGWKRGE